MENKTINQNFKLINRGLVLYLFIFFSVSYLVDTDKAIDMAQLKTLNRLRPEDGYMKEFMNNSAVIEKDRLMKYIYYYKKVTDYVIGSADAFGMLGYSYHRLGNKRKALAYFKKAVIHNPHFFWYHYNIGMIYFKDKKYEEASEAFQRAVTTSKDLTMQYLFSSKIYLPMMTARDPQEGVDIYQHLKEDYYNGIVLLTLSHYKIDNFPSMYGAANYGIQQKLDKKGILAYYAGMASYKLKQPETAVYFLQEAIKADPNNADAYYRLGQILKELGRMQMGVGALQRSAILQKKYGSTLPQFEDFDIKIF